MAAEFQDAATSLVDTSHVLFDALDDDGLDRLLLGLDGDVDVPSLHQVSHQSRLSI